MAALFKKMTPETARLRTLWRRHAHGVEFAAGGCGWTLAAAADVKSADCLAVYGVVGGFEFTLWIAAPDWRVLAGTVLDIPADAVSALPEPLIRAALECFAGDALPGLEKVLAMPVAVTRIETAAPPPPAAALSFRLEQKAGPGAAGAWVIAGNDPAWHAAVETALAAMPARLTVLPDALPLEGVVSAGAWTMPAAALADLGPADVALSPAGADWFLTVGRTLRFAARFEKGVLVAEGKTITQAPPSPAAEEELSPVDAAEVEVQAQVGRVTVTLAQLRRLGEGQIVEFATPVESPVSLVVGGRVVATGELVDVAGRVGVRVIRMAER